MSRPEHAQAHRDSIVANLREVIALVRAGKPLNDGYGMQIKPLHDLAASLDDLTLFASKWEEYAREAGLNPRTGKPLVEAPR